MVGVTQTDHIIEVMNLDSDVEIMLAARVILVPDNNEMFDVGTGVEDGLEHGEQGGAGDDHGHLCLIEAVADGLLTQVGVHGGDNDALREGSQCSQDPLGSGLRINGDGSARLLTQTTESPTKLATHIESLSVAHPLIRSQIQFLEHLSILLFLLFSSEDFPSAKTELVIVLGDRIPPDLVKSINIIAEYQVTVSFVLCRGLLDHANIFSFLGNTMPVLILFNSLPSTSVKLDLLNN